MLTVKLVNADSKNCAAQPNNKETTDTWTVYGTGQKGEIISLVDARCYMGRSSQASVVYACVWIKGGDTYRSGRGNAGGYGYCKRSAAIAQALTAAGIELYGTNSINRWDYDNNRKYTPAELRKAGRAYAKRRFHFGGAGESAIRDALMAVAASLRYTDAAGKIRKYRKITIGR